jgi:hypothetical protein
MRRAALAIALALAVVVPAVVAAPAWPADLNYTCYSPPQSRNATPCGGWHTQPVRLAWSYDPSNAAAVGGTCTPVTISTDTPGTVIRCRIQDAVDLSTTEKSAMVKVDVTRPSIAVVPSRPPDHDGWWTRPVAFGFAGGDATSGLAGCDTIAYAGPDTAATQLTGGCRDAAGNQALMSFTVRYDATPPVLGAVSSIPRDGGVTLSWKPPADAALTQIMRSPGKKGQRASMVYSGTGRRTFTDTSARNGVRYRYVVSVYDPAGNGASQAATATPFSLAPVSGARLKLPPLLRWHQVRRARYYNVQLFRGRHKILSAWPTRTRLRLHRSWTYRHDRMHLSPGRYRWYVWPGYGVRADERYGKLIGHSSFTIVR